MKKGVSIFSTIIFYLLILSGFIVGTAGGSKIVSVLSESAGISSGHTIVIDAGHGGVDGGTTSCTGILESTINLEISLRLEDLFHLLGYKTIMIRTTDRSIHTYGETIAQKKISDLKERVRIINETNNTIFVSIHQNHFSDSRYFGAQVFHTGKEKSMSLAQQMQSNFAATINPGNNRKSKKAEGVYLMNQIEKTGILVECGFLSNPGEEERLRNSDYQKQLCAVIALSVANYLDLENMD